MSGSILGLDASHNDALLALAATSDTGSDSFRVERAPDFFALARYFGEPTYWGAFADGRLVGCVGVTRQKRFLHGTIENVHYLHDVRVDPAHRCQGAFLGLLRRVRNECPGRWVFATILDSNQLAPMLTRKGHMLPSAQAIGKTVHLGVPLFVPHQGAASRVIRLDTDAAWSAYVSLARSIDFAPADEARFRDGDGPFLGIRVAGTVVGVCKLVDQSASRRFLLTQQASRASRLLAVAARLGMRTALAPRDECLRHAYLAYCVGRPEIDCRRDFIAYLSRSGGHGLSHVFVGLSQAQAARTSLLDITLTSTTYAWGDVPRGLSFSFHELTLI